MTFAKEEVDVGHGWGRMKVTLTYKIGTVRFQIWRETFFFFLNFKLRTHGCPHGNSSGI